MPLHVYPTVTIKDPKIRKKVHIDHYIFYETSHAEVSCLFLYTMIRIDNEDITFLFYNTRSTTIDVYTILLTPRVIGLSTSVTFLVFKKMLSCNYYKDL